MGGQTDLRMDKGHTDGHGPTDGLTDLSSDGLISNGWLDPYNDSWTSSRKDMDLLTTDPWMNGRTCKWIDGWTDKLPGEASKRMDEPTDVL